MDKKNDVNMYSSSEGFTLVEVMIAMMIFTIGILAANIMQGTAIKSNNQASNILESLSWGTDQVEQLLNADYDDPLLNDVPVAGAANGNGTGEDANRDGIDDDGGNFGLDDIPGDGSFVSPDGRHNITWNVAVDYPMEGLKTIRLFINRQDWGSMARTISLDYVKSDEI